MTNYNPNDFRRGNLVSFDDKEYAIDSIAEVFPTLNTDEYGIGVVDWDNIQPIRLSIDLLHRFGLTVSRERDLQYFRGNDFMVDCTDNKFRVIMGNFVCSIVICEVEYVHELQNVFYSIKKEELI